MVEKQVLHTDKMGNWFFSPSLKHHSSGALTGPTATHVRRPLVSTDDREPFESKEDGPRKRVALEPLRGVDECAMIVPGLTAEDRMQRYCLTLEYKESKTLRVHNITMQWFVHRVSAGETIHNRRIFFETEVVFRERDPNDIIVIEQNEKVEFTAESEPALMETVFELMESTLLEVGLHTAALILQRFLDKRFFTPSRRVNIPATAFGYSSSTERTWNLVPHDPNDMDSDDVAGVADHFLPLEYTVWSTDVESILRTHHRLIVPDVRDMLQRAMTNFDLQAMRPAPPPGLSLRAMDPNRFSVPEPMRIEWPERTPEDEMRHRRENVDALRGVFRREDMQRRGHL